MTFDHISVAKKSLAELHKAREACAGLIGVYTDKQNEIDGDIQAVEMFLNYAADLEGPPWPAADEVKA